MKTVVCNAFARRARWAACVACALSWFASAAYAEPLLVVDSTYTATAENTQQSHFRIKPVAGVPTNWRMPTDYGSGTVYIRLEVLEKPSAAKTLVTICFEGSTKICSPYPDPYTAPGVYTFSWPFSMFWQIDAIDWTKGVRNVAVVLKTETEMEAQGDPMFYPTKMHVTVQIAPPGETLNADDDAGSQPQDAGSSPPRPDAGRTDAGTRLDAGTRDASTSANTSGMGASRAGTGSTPPMAAAGTGTTPAVAGSTAPASIDMAADAGDKHVTDYLTSDAGCSALGPSRHTGVPDWLAAVAVGLALIVRRSRARRVR